MKKLLVPLFIACFSTAAVSETYLCISEAVGGISWNGREWRGVEFKAGDKYLIKPITLLNGTKSKKLGLHDFGSDTSIASCEWSDNAEWLSCRGLYTVLFNKKTNRFLAAYMEGYTGGRDDNKDTPSIQAGTCSSID